MSLECLWNARKDIRMFMEWKECKHNVCGMQEKLNRIFMECKEKFNIMFQK